jgi:hypothetical protein
VSINVICFDMTGPGDAGGLAAALAAYPSATRAVVFA